MHVKSSLNNQKLGAKYGAFRNLNNNKNTQFQQNYMSMNMYDLTINSVVKHCSLV